MPIRTALGFVLLAGLAAGQMLIEPFSFPAGTTIPGWTEQRGDWTCDGTRVASQGGVTFQELTLDGTNDRDVAAEVVAVYDSASPGLQYAGPVVRHSGSGAAATYFMVKVQDNASPYTGWDYFWVYFYNGASFQAAGISAQPFTPTTVARLRLQVVDEAAATRVTVLIDTDMDGNWNIVTTATTTLGFGTTGKVGVTGYQHCYLDEFRWYSATLNPLAPATIGTSMTIEGRGTAGLLHFAAASLGHTNVFPIGNGLWSPIDFDAFFSFSINTPSIFQNFFNIVPPNGVFNLVLNIPNDPGIVGARLWVAAITHDGSNPIEVTPDLEVVLQ